jgi:lipopolysaccharide/colanic/teichoic acid biosynthesis glycosyltransferase
MIKRLFDLVAAMSGLILLSPLFLFLAVLIRLKLGSPVLFRQIRPGKGGRPFMMLKFRSMTDARAPDGELLPEKERFTTFGRKLRATSLDELPELWNVLKGEMSIVGPRPLLMQYLSLYTPEQQRRHDVKPGITGWAQVKGRNSISWDEKFELDLWYVDHQSFRLDMKIILLTVVNVLLRRGMNCTEVNYYTGTLNQH